MKINEILTEDMELAEATWKQRAAAAAIAGAGAMGGVTDYVQGLDYRNSQPETSSASQSVSAPKSRESDPSSFNSDKLLKLAELAARTQITAAYLAVRNDEGSNQLSKELFSLYNKAKKAIEQSVGDKQQAEKIMQDGMLKFRLSPDYSSNNVPSYVNDTVQQSRNIIGKLKVNSDPVPAPKPTQSVSQPTVKTAPAPAAKPPVASKPQPPYPSSIDNPPETRTPPPITKLAPNSDKKVEPNITPDEAQAVLDNGTKRDIETFGGRQRLEKLAKSKSSKPISVSSDDSMNDVLDTIGRYATNLQRALNKTSDPLKLDRIKSLADGYLTQFKNLIDSKAKEEDTPKTQVDAAKEELENFEQIASDIPVPPTTGASGQELKPPSFANDIKNGKPAPETPRATQSTSPQRAQAPSFANDIKNGKYTGQTGEVGYDYRTTGSGKGYTKNGDLFSGEWKNGFPNGYGQRTLLSDQWTGKWLSKGKMLTTEFRGGMPVDGARATVTSQDGQAYSGYIKYTGKDSWMFDYRK